MNKFCERLNQTLRENNLSQNKFAKEIGMSQSIVNNYCTGKREPSLDALVVICKALGETSDYMLGMSDY